MEVFTLLGICLIVSILLSGLWLMATEKSVGFGEFVTVVTTSLALLWFLPLLLMIGVIFGAVKLVEATVGLLQRQLINKL